MWRSQAWHHLPPQNCDHHPFSLLIRCSLSKISTIFLLLAGWSRPILLFSLEMCSMPKRSLSQQSVDTGVRLSFFITHIQTQIQIQIQILCVNKALTPSCPLSFFFSDASFPISPSFQLLAAVASQIRKLSPLNVSWDFWGQIQPISFLDSSMPLVTMFWSPDKSSWQEKSDPHSQLHTFSSLTEPPWQVTREEFPFFALASGISRP